MPLLQSHLRRATRVEIHGQLSTMFDLLRRTPDTIPYLVYGLCLEFANVWTLLQSSIQRYRSIAKRMEI